MDNVYKAITKANFLTISNNSKVFLSFGEIDCRGGEGFIVASQKQNSPKEKLIHDTVSGYLEWFFNLNKQKNHKIYIFNVPAPVYNQRISNELNKSISDTVRTFNATLASIVRNYDFELIDVYKFTIDEKGFSNSIYHIDDHHLGSVAVTEIQKQIYN